MKAVLRLLLIIGLWFFAGMLAVNAITIIVVAVTPRPVKVIPDTVAIKEINRDAFRIGYLLGLGDGLNRDRYTARISLHYRLRMMTYDTIMNGTKEDRDELTARLEKEALVSQR